MGYYDHASMMILQLAIGTQITGSGSKTLTPRCHVASTQLALSPSTDGARP